MTSTRVLLGDRLRGGVLALGWFVWGRPRAQQDGAPYPLTRVWLAVTLGEPASRN